MRWSWTVGRVAGIRLRVHATFVLLLAWLALADYRVGGTAGAVVGVLFTLALFASVVLHELGHALVARRFGVRTRDITLLPIGGVARLEAMPRKPAQELWIAIAGPAVTLAVAVVLFVLLRALGVSPELAGDINATRRDPGAFVRQLMWANVSLLVFNLLPAFPMDGGRVLRALLAMRMDHARATAYAARIGRAFALLFGIVGLMYNAMLVLIALFVWLAASTEEASARMRSSMAGLPVERVMIGDVRTLRPRDTLDAALRALLDGFQQDFPVVEDDGRVVGILTRAGTFRALGTRGRETVVADAMERSFGTAQVGEPLEEATSRLVAGPLRMLPVLHDGRLFGVLTLDNVEELVMIDAALRSAASAGTSART